ncbi:hypothetical protein SCHPADRAFT_499171 [Schizopora paradoxa]|uniref:Uncharacterized protein n=1 Tax=Schizopora paradoxa TaxID=27342 RepID=A0A0H2RG52_9AGAM|nr:hypothetical protein SCHPADRAFT_499171 [Schizopora paradoxa]
MFAPEEKAHLLTSIRIEQPRHVATDSGAPEVTSVMHSSGVAFPSTFLSRATRTERVDRASRLHPTTYTVGFRVPFVDVSNQIKSLRRPDDFLCHRTP